MSKGGWGWEPWAWIVVIGTAIAGAMTALYDAGVRRGKNEATEFFTKAKGKANEQTAELGDSRHAEKVRSREERDHAVAGNSAAR